MISELEVSDWVIPRAVISGVWSPIDRLQLVAVLQCQADASAEGRMELTANGIQGVPLQSCNAEKPGSHCYVDGVQVQVPFPTLEASLGLRFSRPRAGEGSSGDPLQDELWDVELDLTWTQTSQVDSIDVTIHDILPDRPDAPRVQFGNGAGASSSYIRFGSSIPKNWQDTWTGRLGGAYNLVPSRLALRAGASFASRAVPLPTMNIDFWPVRKLGMHLGATLALAAYRLSLGYAHLFYQPVIVSRGTGQVKDIATVNQAEADAVNEGRYDAVQDILTLQVNRSF